MSLDAAFRRVTEGFVEPREQTWESSDALWTRLVAQGRIVSRHHDGEREPYRVHLVLVEHPDTPAPRCEPRKIFVPCADAVTGNQLLWTGKENTMSISVERIGRRSYLRGDTFPVKDVIKAAGGHWDGEERAWWVGDNAKAVEIATSIAAAPQTATGSYRKLQDGSWGVRGRNMVPGGKVTVTKASGERQEEVVASVIATEPDGSQVVTIVPRARPTATPKFGWSGSQPRGTFAPAGRRCPQCGGRECSKAFNPRDLCDED